MRLLAGGSLAPVVGPALGVEAELGDRGDVDHVVHPPVPGPGEPVPVLLTGGGVQAVRCRSRTRTGCGRRTGRCLRRRPGPGRRPPARRRAGPSDREPRARTMVLSSAVAFLILASTATSSASSSAAMRRRVFPAMSRGRTLASIALACQGVMSFLRLPGQQLGQQRLQPVHGLNASPGKRFAAVREHPQRLELAVDLSTRRPLVRTATIAIECASSASVLRLCPVSKSRTRAASLAGTSEDVLAGLQQPLRQRAARHRSRPRPPRSDRATTSRTRASRCSRPGRC